MELGTFADIEGDRIPVVVSYELDDNIQLLRGICNKQKRAKHPIDFMQQKGYLL